MAYSLRIEKAQSSSGFASNLVFESAFKFTSIFADIQLSGTISPKQYAFLQDTDLRRTAIFRAKVLCPISNMQNKKNFGMFF